MSSLCERTEPPNGGLIKINMIIYDSYFYVWIIYIKKFI